MNGFNFVLLLLFNLSIRSIKDSLISSKSFKSIIFCISFLWTSNRFFFTVSRLYTTSFNSTSLNLFPITSWIIFKELIWWFWKPISLLNKSINFFFVYIFIVNLFGSSNVNNKCILCFNRTWYWFLTDTLHLINLCTRPRII